MSSYICPVCGNPNHTNQEYCPECDFPVTRLLSAFDGLKKEQVLKWAKEKYFKLQKIEKDKADLAEGLDQLRKQLPQHIVVEYADQQRLNDPKSKLVSKISEWNKNMGEFSSSFDLLITSNLLKSKPGTTNSVQQIQSNQNPFINLAAKQPKEEQQPQSQQSNQEQSQLQYLTKEDLSKIFQEERLLFQAQIPNWSQTISVEVLSQLDQQLSDSIANKIIAALVEATNKNLTNSPHENVLEENIPRDENTEKPTYQIIQQPAIQSPEVSSSQHSAESQFPWVLAYNQNPEFFSEFAVEVSETEESINQRRRTTNQAVIIEKVRKGRGNYCLLTVKSGYYLLPKGDLKINQFNMPTVEELFKFIGYSPENYHKFLLVKPAIVFPIEPEQKWQLQERGVLQF
ncbi:hypothetical protein NIES2100_61760 [Calothrix sp. NIES-2100]|nr:hypothetical protein NIES2100_61760 [Calothrix sp. NIES-2100]